MHRKILFRWVIGLWLAGTGQVRAQPFRDTAGIDPVPATGFYAIGVTPMLSAQLRTDFSDLRIKDESGNEVAYLLESVLPRLYEDRYQGMPIRTNAVDDSGNNVIVIENSPVTRTDGFRLFIQNAAVSRTIDLAGSNDTARWFSIVENIGLERRFVQDRDSFSEQLSFPLSSYKYFRITIRNGRNNPLKVLSVDRLAGHGRAAPPVLLANPSLGFTSADSNRFTTLGIRNPLHFHISQVTLRVKSPRFFQRHLTCFAGVRQVGDFVVTSDSVLELALPALNDSVITVRIYNEDNPPLQITSVATDQYAEKMIAYLETGKTYRLEINSDQAVSPHYDLIHFKDSIPQNIPALGFSTIRRLVPPPAIPVKSDSNGWLWPCLVFVILVLGLSAYRLTRDVAQEKAK